MSAERILMIGIGAAAMLFYTLLRRKQFPDVALWKIPAVMVILTVAGVLGTILLFFVENGNFGGTSFYGAVLCVPILMVPAMALRLKYSTILDMCAGAECAMLAVMKVDCLMGTQCCYGKQVYWFGTSFQFPSQIAEMINSIGLAIFLYFAYKKMRRGSQYPLYMLTYGFTRFLLNSLRYVAPDEYILGIAQGQFWSLVSMAIGGVWLAVLYADKVKAAFSGKSKKK